jgi:hypothetical protein
MQQRKASLRHLLNCLQRSRNAGFSCYNVMPSPWLHFVCCYKRPLKEEEGLLLFGLFDWLLALSIGKKLLLWAFWCGKLLEGKRIIKGKMLKRGR